MESYYVKCGQFYLQAISPVRSWTENKTEASKFFKFQIEKLKLSNVVFEN